MCSKLTIKTPERRNDVVLMFLLLALNIPFSGVSLIDFKQVNIS